MHGPASGGAEPTLDAKVSFLSGPDAYPSPGGVIRRETHMSWVFLVGDQVYKLKKPVRFPYLDFSTLDRREAACRAELLLNRALAPDVYLDVVPLVDTGAGLAIGGAGKPVDWLVVMRRLDDHAATRDAVEILVELVRFLLDPRRHSRGCVDVSEGRLNW